MVTYTVPGMKSDSAERVIRLLQDRLNSLSDLALTLKHVHWNVTGPNFIAVHTMLDPQAGQLEQYHWFVRAHLEAPDGSLSTGAASTEKSAAKRARKR